ncbi:MAG TPA: hypothetical protein VK119_02165 [Bacillota bacterium]|nr:hypothetical protein [Bacillota bacterium]
MPKVHTHFATLFFLLTALSGVWMRLFPLHMATAIPYTNVLHAHSHLAILGWAFLGTFIIFLSIQWDYNKRKKEAKAISVTLFITSLVMFIAFLYQGYGLVSIILSTLHIFVEYWTASFIFRHLKMGAFRSQISNLFIKGSLVALLLSSLGPFALGYISSTGMKESAFFDMAIYFYLHFQYNGWLYLFLIGLLITILHYKKITLSTSLLTASFWIYFIALFPGYLLSILWVDVGTSGSVLAIVGSIGQWVGVLCLLFAFKGTSRQLMSHFSKGTIGALGVTLFLLLIKSSMELGLMSPGMANLIYDTRSIVIGYLHLTLLGFISIFILTQYRMVHILESNRLTFYGSILFGVGFMLNEVLLFGDGLLTWLNKPHISFYESGLLIASMLLTVGIITLWFSVTQNSPKQI